MNPSDNTYPEPTADQTKCHSCDYPFYTKSMQTRTCLNTLTVVYVCDSCMESPITCTRRKCRSN